MDFAQSIKELEDNHANNIDKIEEVLDDMSPEELEAASKLTDDDFKSDSTASPEEDKAIAGKTEPTKTDVKADESEDDDAPEPEENANKAPQSGLVEINDEYISKADEKDRKILQGMKGRKADPELIKSFIEAQRMLGKQASELGILKGKTTQQETDPTNKPKTENENLGNETPKIIPEQEITEQIQKLIDEETLNQLRNKYTELPTDPEEIDEYFAAMNSKNPRLFQQYLRDEEAISKKVRTVFNEAIYYENNKVTLNAKSVKTAYDKIASEIKDYGIEDPAKIGLDLTLKEDEKGNIQNPLLNELLTTDGKNLDPNVVTMHGRAPIINADALFNKFFFKKGKVLRDALKEATKIEGRKDAFETIADNKTKANNSATLPKSAGNVTGKNLDRFKTEDDLDEASPEEINELVKISSNKFSR